MKDLVDKDGKVYERDNLILLGGGSNSYTFSYDDEDMKKVIKLFKRECLDFALNPYVAGIIKLLPLKSYPNFYSILEQDGEYLGYVMEYFERCDNLLLDMTKDSLITSFQAMEEDVSSFSRGHLLMSDVRSYNLLFSSDGLAHLVDYDMFQLRLRTNPDSLKLYNSDTLSSFVRSTFGKEVSDEMTFTDDERIQIYGILDEIFPVYIPFLPSESIADMLEDGETPRQFFKKRVK